MGGGKDNHPDKGFYPPIGYPPIHSTGSYASAPPVAYPYPYSQHGSICPPSLGSYPYSSSMYSSHNGYPQSGYPSYNQSAYPSMGGYPGASLYATQYHAGAATTYDVHHLTHGHHPHGHHLGHFGKFKDHHHGYYGKFKHGKFGKHHHHGFFGGKYKKWK